MLSKLTTTDAGDPASRWFAVFVKTPAERSVAKLLKTRGDDEFVPTYEKQDQWADRSFTLVQHCCQTRTDHRSKL
jgi:hypothetical protein